MHKVGKFGIDILKCLYNKLDREGNHSDTKLSRHIICFSVLKISSQLKILIL